MSRRISTQKRFPEKDFKYDNLLVSLLINRILKSGKKRLARRIVYKAFALIELRTNQNPILILEKAIRNISSRIKLKKKIINGVSVKIPVILNRYYSINLALCWLIESANKRIEKKMFLKLGNEIFDNGKIYKISNCFE